MGLVVNPRVNYADFLGQKLLELVFSQARLLLSLGTSLLTKVSIASIGLHAPGSIVT